MRVPWLYTKDESYRGAFRHAIWARDFRVWVVIDFEEDRLEVVDDVLSVRWRRHGGVARAMPPGLHPKISRVGGRQ